MTRECKTMADVTKAIQGDIHKKSLTIIYDNKNYHFRNNSQIKGAALLIKAFCEGSKELNKLLTGTKNVKED